MQFRTIIALAVALTGLPRAALCIDVLFIDTSKKPSSAFSKVEEACRFYGLDLETISAPGEALSGALLKNVGEGEPEAIIVTAPSLAASGMRDWLYGMRSGPEETLHLLVVDVDSSTDGMILEELSSGAINGCQNIGRLPGIVKYRVTGDKAVAENLSRQEFETKALAVEALIGDPARQSHPLIQISRGHSDPGYPVFNLVADGTREAFFLARFVLEDAPPLLRPGIKNRLLLEMLPILMFLRHACNERCWHSPAHFANLTIDDPWLREPYGDLRLGALLEEMETANFHTTIAFVPWNFDRSEPEAVSLFRSRPDRLSLCLHGNNHDHREFSEFISLRDQEQDIIQGLARMEAFTRLTGVAFDRVMVFPHSIASAETLSLLKKHNFLGTVNADNIPAGAPPPRNPLDRLRRVTLDYANFPSMKREQAERETEGEIAFDLFLDNPVLLYSHHDLFRRGADAFNDLAERINRLEPSIRWTGLGTIARSSYLIRKRKDSDYDVLAFSRLIELMNSNDAAANYHVMKPETYSHRILRVTVDGIPYPWDKGPQGIQLTLSVPPQSRRLIELDYENSSDLRFINLEKNDRRIGRLRRISDFRDITLSQNVAGRMIIALYYESGAYRWGIKRLLIAALIATIVIGVIIWLAIRQIRRIRRKQKLSRRTDKP